MGCNGEAEPRQHMATFFFLLGILWVSSLSHPCYSVDILGIHFVLVQMKSYMICLFVTYFTFPVLRVTCVATVFPWLSCFLRTIYVEALGKISFMCSHAVRVFSVSIHPLVDVWLPRTNGDLGVQISPQEEGPLNRKVLRSFVLLLCWSETSYSFPQ